MFKILIQHEILSLLKSKRVIWSVSIFFILYMVIFTIRVKDFNQRNQVYIEDVKTAQKVVEEAVNYSFTKIPIIKKPMLYSIFNEGYTHNFGTYILASPLEPIYSAIFQNSSSNQVYDPSNRMDITFLITFFLSLFVFLISFDSINYEKEKHLLRLLFSYPVKRTHYIFKKILGITLLVILVFSIPFIFSNLYLMITNSMALSIHFISFSLIYYFFTLIYLFSITLIGVYISVLCHKPSKALIFVLTVWIGLTIIIPTLYDFVGKQFFNKIKKQTSLQETNNKYNIFISNHFKDLPKEVNPNKHGHINWNGGLTSTIKVYGKKTMYNAHINYVKWVYKNLYPIYKKIETNNNEIFQLKHRFEKIEPNLFFLNPVTQFEAAAEILSMTGPEQYKQFLNDAQSLRSEWTEKGVKDNWLFSKNYICSADTALSLPSLEEYLSDKKNRKRIMNAFNFKYWGDDTPKIVLNRINKYGDDEKIPPKISTIIKDYNKLWFKPITAKIDFKIPETPKYESRYFRLSNVLVSILLRFLMIGLFSSGLLVAIVAKFKNYDIR